MLCVLGAFAELKLGTDSGNGITLANQRGFCKRRKRTLSPERAAEPVPRAAGGIPKTVLAVDYGISRKTVYQYLRQAKRS
ncbi:MAG TPA: helix-turn-helix domain-containing protein [Arthrobacter sp.]|jgi:hypothetical protein|uniref:helix-turn-helix domain-containing protein n=1 Tax=Arthrobacter sp. TaxID=1667 RepID=UPI002F41579E